MNATYFIIVKEPLERPTYYSFTEPYKPNGEPIFTTNISNAHYFLTYDSAKATLKRIKKHNIKKCKIIRA